MATITRSVEDLARQFHHAVSTGTWTLLPDIFTSDATWTFPGENTISGTARGVEEIAAKATLIGSYGLSINLERVLFGEDSFVLTLHNVGTRDGLVLDEHLATVCALRDGLIATADTHLSDIDGMNAFFVPLA